jgi:HSP20 family protein
MRKWRDWVVEMSKVKILNELESMRRRMETLFAESFGADKSDDPEAQRETEAWQPAVDVFENEGEWMLHADLPGVLDEDLKVEVNGSQLSIVGMRNTLFKSEDLNVSRVERPEGSFSRMFDLPPNLRKDEIRAELKQGVLKVTIPKTADPQGPRKILVRMD